MQDCIFCKIINKEQKADIVYEDEKIIVFKDINPKDKTHLLIIPKKHIKSLNKLKNINLAGKMLLLPQKIMQNQDYKIQINTGKKAGQIIEHLHMHLLSGKIFQKEVTNEWSK